MEGSGSPRNRVVSLRITKKIRSHENSSITLIRTANLPNVNQNYCLCVASILLQNLIGASIFTKY
jgi:hypothetical protein